MSDLTAAQIVDRLREGEVNLVLFQTAATLIEQQAEQIVRLAVDRDQALDREATAVMVQVHFDRERIAANGKLARVQEWADSNEEVNVVQWSRLDDILGVTE